MAKPRLSGKTPDEQDYNTLIGDLDSLVHDPSRRRFAVIEYNVPEQIVRTGGDSIPRVQIIHFEGMTTVEQIDAARALLEGGYSARTGQKSRPEPDLELDLPTGTEPTA